MSKENIIKDFKSKQKTYYRNNYVYKNRINYLRRLRNERLQQKMNKTQHCENVLDVGCGPAILYPQILKRCKHYFALDLVESNLEEIKIINQNNKIIPIQNDIDTFSWDNNYFDVIICAGSLEYVKTPEKSILKLVKYLKPGGTLICSFPNFFSPYRIWSAYVYEYIWRTKNKLLGKETNTYPRKLFKPNNLINYIKLETYNSLEINTEFLGVKLLLQPFDRIFEQLDYNIIKYFEHNRYQFADRISQEFILIIKKTGVNPGT